MKNKSILLFFVVFYLQVGTTVAQDSEQELPNIIQFSIDEYGLAKSSSSSHVNYDIQNYKLNYNYNYNGSMGLKHADENRTKKFPYRLQQAIYSFLRAEGSPFLEHKQHDIDDNSAERMVDIRLSYVYNGELIEWAMKGGQKTVEAHSDYKKVLELEALIREVARLGEKEF